MQMMMMILRAARARAQAGSVALGRSARASPTKKTTNSPHPPQHQIRAEKKNERQQFARAEQAEDVDVAELSRVSLVRRAGEFFPQVRVGLRGERAGRRAAALQDDLGGGARRGLVAISLPLVSFRFVSFVEK